MRRIKLIVIVLFALPLLALTEKFSSVFKATGQSTTLPAPTGVIASDNSYSTKVGLTWDTMRGVTLYRVFRNTINDPNGSTNLGTTAAGAFFDTTAVVGQTYFYWVRSENGTLVSSFSQPDLGVRASGNIPGPLQPLNPPPAPPGNPVTATKAYLGKVLFWDEQLSSTRTVSCGTCHFAGNGGSDARSIVNNLRSTNPGADSLFGTADDVYASPGVPTNNSDGTYSWSETYGFKEQVTGRKAKSYIDAGYSPLLFWDGRATGTFTDPISGAVLIANGAALESQALGPPVSSAEMAHSGRNWNDVASRIAVSKPLALSPSVPTALNEWIGGRSYPELFTEAFGTSDVTPARIAMAIATFERTLYSDRTPLDAAVSSIAALTPAEARGQQIFNGPGRCNTCHVGNLLTDNLFHNIGLRPQTEDPGRFAVTGNVNELGEFRTASLRNVELRAPYMHFGHFATLDDVVAFYNRGGDFDAPNIDRNRIRPLGLNAQQRADLVAFLKRPLTDPRVAAGTAQFDRPTLYTESNRVPQLIGNGTTGSGGNIPQVMAIEPPLAGNPSFSVAVSNALGGAQAVLIIDSNDPGTGPNIPATGSLARVSIQLSGSGAGQGRGSVSISIPATTAIIGASFTGRWFVVDSNAPGGVAVSQGFKFTVFGEGTTGSVRAKYADFDGDGKTDISVFRPSDANWYILQSISNTPRATNFGISTDRLAPDDYDGDGKADIAVFRENPANQNRADFFILKSSNNALQQFQFGRTGDLPVAGDWDGDGRADLGVYRDGSQTGAQSFFFYRPSSQPGTDFVTVQWGTAGDKPVASDFDGDGKTDAAVFRPSNGSWYVLQSSNNQVSAIQFGTNGDRAVAGDYDGDRKTDLAVFRPSSGSWYVLRSSDQTFRAAQFGISTDIPTPGDYDGDGLSDFAVFRPSSGHWFIMHNNNNSVRIVGWGLSQDIPVPSVSVP
jgi:Cytochrome c peroxidase